MKSALAILCLFSASVLANENEHHNNTGFYYKKSETNLIPVAALIGLAWWFLHKESKTEKIKDHYPLDVTPKQKEEFYIMEGR